MAALERRYRTIFVAGATGFVGRALVPALLQRGYRVRAGARHVEGHSPQEQLEYVRCDLLEPQSLMPALAGCDAACYLVHSLGSSGNFRVRDLAAATVFADAAARTGIQRIVYLGGVAPRGEASEHLASRLEVGRVLRQGPVPCLELRAAMIMGRGSASWQIVRDLALRLPAMILPAWLRSRLSPIALEDAVQALVDGLEVPLPRSAWFDIPGRDTLTGKEILERIAALEDRRLPTLSLPWLTPRLSAVWLRLVTEADFTVARELVLGLREDLLPHDRRYEQLTGHPPRFSFDTAARAALREPDRRQQGASRLGRLEEALVRAFPLRARAGAARA